MRRWNRYVRVGGREGEQRENERESVPALSKRGRRPKNGLSGAPGMASESIVMICHEGLHPVPGASQVHLRRAGSLLESSPADSSRRERARARRGEEEQAKKQRDSAQAGDSRGTRVRVRLHAKPKCKATRHQHTRRALGTPTTTRGYPHARLGPVN